MLARTARLGLGLGVTSGVSSVTDLLPYADFVAPTADAVGLLARGEVEAFLRLCNATASGADKLRWQDVPATASQDASTPQQNTTQGKPNPSATASTVSTATANTSATTSNVFLPTGAAAPPRGMAALHSNAPPALYAASSLARK